MSASQRKHVALRPPLSERPPARDFSENMVERVRTTLHRDPLCCIISSVKFRVFLQMAVTGSDSILKQADLKN